MTERTSITVLGALDHLQSLTDAHLIDHSQHFGPGCTGGPSWDSQLARDVHNGLEKLRAAIADQQDAQRGVRYPKPEPETSDPDPGVREVEDYFEARAEDEPKPERPTNWSDWEDTGLMGEDYVATPKDEAMGHSEDLVQVTIQVPAYVADIMRRDMGQRYELKPVLVEPVKPDVPVTLHGGGGAGGGHGFGNADLHSPGLRVVKERRCLSCGSRWNSDVMACPTCGGTDTQAVVPRG